MITRYVTSTYEIADAYKDVLVVSADAEINIESSNDAHTRLVIFEKKRKPYKLSVENGTLTVKPLKDKWYNRLRIGIDRSKISLYVPKDAVETMSVISDVAHIDIRSIVCSGTLDIQNAVGRASVQNVSCKRFDSKGNTGAITLENCIAKESITIKRNTGKVSLNGCSAPEIHVKTNTGRVCGRLPAGTMFAAKSNTGKIKLPKAPLGEVINTRCEIKTNTGNIEFEY